MEVRDTGVGIAPENIGKLFTPFAQANSSTGREHGGSGLGLSICTQIVKNMAGTIAVSSELGKGSHFTARLLLDVCDDESIRRGLGTSAGSYSNSPNLRRMIDAQNDATAAAAVAAAATHTGGEVTAASSGLDNTAVTPSSPVPTPSPERLLIVDDQPVNIKLLQRMLSSLGFQIDVAHNGVEALAKIKACGYVSRSAGGGKAKEASCGYLCCFLDLQMPVMNGWQCVAHIRQQLHLSSLPVIALTAESIEPTKATDAGFSMALAKPFRKPALLDILEPLLEAKRRAALAPSIATTAPSSTAAGPPGRLHHRHRNRQRAQRHGHRQRIRLGGIGGQRCQPCTLAVSVVVLAARAASGRDALQQALGLTALPQAVRRGRRRGPGPAAGPGAARVSAIRLS